MYNHEKEVILKWNNNNPEYHIAFNPIPEGLETELIIKNSIIRGKSPDIVQGVEIFFANNLAFNGFLVALDTLEGFNSTIKKRGMEIFLDKLRAQDGHIYVFPQHWTPVLGIYNKKLLETAKNSVISILKAHPKYSESKYDFQKIGNYFQPFQEFILNKLLNKEERKKFDRKNYISFNKFRKYLLNLTDQEKLNCKLPNKEKYSAELLWHIIRTYIKGFSSENYLFPNEYEKLNQKDKSVTHEMYNDVFNTIWTNWYKKFFEKYNLWDDQDLIRYVLKNKNKNNFPKYPVIFCDEAQDYTKIEIDLLLNLSIFINYNLENYNNNIPFSFAGDPYQTINPTGFRWESVKTIFNDTFKEINSTNLKINFKELHLNYRSKPLIIKFANFIQALRYKFLNIKELKPQLSWQIEQGIKPCLFIIGDNIQPENLKDVLNETIIIIPSEAGENAVKNFIEIDDIMNIPFDKNNFVKNIMTSSTSKGLEFEKVIIYKFGENVPESFSKVLKNKALNDSEYIELSHFFNKLYVAISRAKDQLYIVVSDREKNQNMKDLVII